MATQRTPALIQGVNHLAERFHRLLRDSTDVLFKFVEMAFGVRWLGASLEIEAALCFISIIFGLLVLKTPSNELNTPSLYDLAWHGWGRWLAVPFILKTLLSGLGVITNIQGWRGNHVLRFLGAFVGSLIWFTLTAKYAAIHETLALGFSGSLVFGFLSLRIMALSILEEPKPRLWNGQ